MEFRPCIDIHNGKVKQIVGGSLKDLGDRAQENFVSEQDAAFYAKLYQKNSLKGGHIILLNASDSPYYEATRNRHCRPCVYIREDCRSEEASRRRMRQSIWQQGPPM